ncbi:MAG: hypothetical protein R8G66_05295 [Cytophagales bacterium]|nr:hypothetical protein [Cytophagales bacterium]
MKFALPEGHQVYVSDVPNFDQPSWKIIKYDHKGENPEVFTEEELAWPQDLVFLEDRDEVLISNLSSGKINRHNSTTGEFIATFAADISGPTRTRIGPDGLLYVLQWAGSGKVLRYDLDGTLVDEFTETGVPQSIGLDWDDAGNLYVSSFQNNQVIKFDTEGKSHGVFTESGNTQGPTNIWFTSDGNLMVNDWKAGKIVVFDAAGQFIETFATGLSQVEGVSVLSDGSVLIGNGGTGAVKLYDAEGTFIEDFVAARSGGLGKPNAVIVRTGN